MKISNPEFTLCGGLSGKIQKRQPFRNNPPTDGRFGFWVILGIDAHKLEPEKCETSVRHK